MPATRPILSPLIIPASSLPSPQLKHKATRTIPSHPQIEDPYARHRRPSTDTIDGIPTPMDTSTPAYTRHPAVTVVDHAGKSAPSSTYPPQRQKPNQYSRFPVKTQNVASALPHHPVTANGMAKDTFHNVHLDPTDDLEKSKLAAQYEGLQQRSWWTSAKVMLAFSAVVAIGVTVGVVVAAMEFRKKHPEHSGKI